MVTELCSAVVFAAARGADLFQLRAAVVAEFCVGSIAFAAFRASAFALCILYGGRNAAHRGPDVFGKLIQHGRRFVFYIPRDLFSEPEQEHGDADEQQGKACEYAPKLIGHTGFSDGSEKICKADHCENYAGGYKNPDSDDLKFEISDFMYHCMILMAQKNITWAEIAGELAQR